MKRFFILFLSFLMVFCFSSSAVYAVENTSLKTVNVYLDNTVEVVSFIKEVERINGEVLSVKVNRYYNILPVVPRLPILQEQSFSKSIGVSTSDGNIGHSVGVSYSLSEGENISYSTSYGVSVTSSENKNNNVEISQGVSQGVSVSKSITEIEPRLNKITETILIAKVKIPANKINDLFNIKGVVGISK